MTGEYANEQLKFEYRPKIMTKLQYQYVLFQFSQVFPCTRLQKGKNTKLTEETLD